MRLSSLPLAFLALFLAGCQAPPDTTAPRPAPRASPPAAAPFRQDKLEAMDQAILAAIADSRLPGGVLWFERSQQNHHRAYGHRAVEPQREPMSADTLFDAASLTKVMATAPAVALLLERGKLQLDLPARTYLPAFHGDGRENITVRHLLTHTSGLRPGIPARPAWSGYEAGIQRAIEEKPTTQPGTLFRYSDVNFILLGEIVRIVSGVSLADFTAREFYRPLGMTDTGFLPSAAQLPRIAPTTRETNGLVIRGVVHDPTSRRMGGIAGHAGLFITARDTARFARMLLHEGQLDGVRVLRPETVRQMIGVQSPSIVPDRRGLGWDIDSPYAGPRGDYFPLGSYGHTGWTGTSLWIDPFSKSFLVFLSNRNHPTEAGSVLALRSRLGTLAAEAIADFNMIGINGTLPPRPNDPSARRARSQPALAETLNGIDVLATNGFAELKGKRVGLITNHTGQDRQRNPTIDLLHAAPGVQLKALFSPEHGIRGTLDAKISDSVDEKTGLPVLSLYGESRKPSATQLQGLDILVFDIQDIGCRFYTYISTMGLAMEAAAENKIAFMVLDRVNPINGSQIEGPVHTGASSFVAFHKVPLRHGMTAGELARMFKAERYPACDLSVIPLRNWTRDLWLDQTALPWTNPSPNMRSLNAATLYPGVGLLESAVSVGRGTDTPFEILGAPYADDLALVRELNGARLPGIRFLPVRFTPKASVFKDQPCRGVALVITDRDALNSLDLGITLALTFQRLYPASFALEKMQPLLQHTNTLAAIREGRPLAEIRQLWAPLLEEFKQRRQPHLLYR